MMEELNRYTVAVKLNFRDLVPENWVDIFLKNQDVEIVNSTEFRAGIRATPATVERIRKRFNNVFIVEEIIERKIL